MVESWSVVVGWISLSSLACVGPAAGLGILPDPDEVPRIVMHSCTNLDGFHGTDAAVPLWMEAEGTGIAQRGAPWEESAVLRQVDSANYDFAYRWTGRSHMLTCGSGVRDPCLPPFDPLPQGWPLAPCQPPPAAATLDSGGGEFFARLPPPPTPSALTLSGCRGFLVTLPRHQAPPLGVLPPAFLFAGDRPGQWDIGFEAYECTTRNGVLQTQPLHILWPYLDVELASPSWAPWFSYFSRTVLTDDGLVQSTLAGWGATVHHADFLVTELGVAPGPVAEDWLVTVGGANQYRFRFERSGPTIPFWGGDQFHRHHWTRVGTTCSRIDVHHEDRFFDEFGNVGGALDVGPSADLFPITGSSAAYYGHAVRALRWQMDLHPTSQNCPG